MRIFLLLLLLAASRAAFADRKIAIEDLDRTAMTCGHGGRAPLVGRSIDGGLLTLGGTLYEHGLGVHAPSLLTVPVGGNALAFDATVGIDDEMKGRKSSMVFNVWADDKCVATSGLLKRKKRVATLHADLRGARVVTLEVTDGGDGDDSDHADWANAFFLFKDGTGPVRPAELTRQLGLLTPPTPDTPRINGAVVFGVRPGHPILWRIPVSGDRPMSITVEGLPPGTYFDTTNACVLGAVVRSGSYPLTIAAQNARGRAVRTVTLTVGAKIALTPPMGWNSWNVFGGAVNDEKVRTATEAMISSGLADHGWNYINIDDYWQNRPGEKTDASLMGPAREADGTIKPNARFPDMKALADFVHSKGLRVGLYSSPGPTTCGGCVGSWQHEFQDARTYAAWGYDYLKYDWCSYGRVAVGTGLNKARYPYWVMGKALREQDRDIVFSLCQYGMDNVSAWGAQTYGSCWRTTGDVFDNWGSIYGSLTKQADLWCWAGPDAWNDPDMLCVGRVRWNGFKGSRLTPNEQYTHLSLWCLVGAPLMIGCDMTRLDDFTRGLLMNDEVIAIDQDPLGATAAKVFATQTREIWVRPLADGSVAAGLLNSGLTECEIVFDFAALGLEGDWQIRDLWRQTDEGTFTGTYRHVVYGHATHLIRLIPGVSGRIRPGLADVRDGSWLRTLRQQRTVETEPKKALSDTACEHCKRRQAQ